LGYPRKKKPTQKELIALAEKHYGNMSSIADEIGYSRSQVCRFYKHPKLEEAIKEAKENIKSIAKKKLHEKILDGNLTAIIFYLKTKCGFSEKNKLEVETKPQVEGWDINILPFEKSKET